MDLKLPILNGNKQSKGNELFFFLSDLYTCSSKLLMWKNVRTPCLILGGIKTPSLLAIFAIELAIIVYYTEATPGEIVITK